jgi:hypothetical protein
MPKKKTVTSKAKKSQKVGELNQTDGMATDNRTEPTSLEQIWGDNGTYKYKTLAENEYEGTLAGMSKSDLKHEAIRVGLLPIDNTEQLKTRLLKEFRSHATKYNKPKTDQTLNPGVGGEARKILEEGR